MAYKRTNADKSLWFGITLDEKQIKELNAQEITNEEVIKLYVEKWYDADLVKDRITLLNNKSI